MNKVKKSSSGCGLVGFGIAWTLFSSFFFLLGIKSVYDGINRSQWLETPCEVTKFQIPGNKPQLDPPFQPKVKYQYSWKGSNYTGDQLWPKKKGVKKFEGIAETFEQYRDKKLTTCYVNPDKPQQSALIISKSDIWIGFIPALAGAGFMAIGLGMIILGRKEKKKKGSALSSQSTKDDKAPALLLIPFFSVFTLAGIGILIFVVMPTGKKYLAAKSWQETPAKVIWSKVRSHDSDDGTTYSVDIFYRYTFNGRVYRSNTGGLMSGSSSGYSAKKEVTKAHPRGTKIVCYVNPEKPWQAIRKRDLGWSALFALFPLPFITIGVGGLWWMARKRKEKNYSQNPYLKKSNKQRTTPFQKHQKYPKPQIEFTPRGSRIKTLITTLLFTTFWCGITSIFVVIAAKSWLRNDPEWFLTIFITPFVIVGIGGILYSCYRFLTIFSPSHIIQLKPSAITIDDSAKVSWSVRGGIGSIHQFSIYLVGKEKATYRQGTNTKTAEEIFYAEPLIKTDDPRTISRGSTRINLAKSSNKIMPTWKGSNNRITWSLIVTGKIHLWPDVVDSYEINIKPLDVTP